VGSKIKFRPVTGVCLLVAVVFVIMSIVYFTQTAANLPSFFPGHQAGSTHHHVKHGIAMLALAVVAVIGAWFTTAPATRSGGRTSG
jgi:amino acid permease